ncbi:MAG: hypothetical protein IJ167_10930 [Lachnospiraceae bacterium]|nr:hypothetical protein [Lachnospiraceae bacterium]
MNFETFIEEIKSDDEVPEVVDLGIEEALSVLSKKKTKQNNFSRNSFKRYAIGFIVVFVGIVTVSVSAKTYIYWPGVIEERFSLDFFDKIILENNGYIMNPSTIRSNPDILYAEKDGVTISVTQTVSDGDSVFIGLYITGLDEYAGKELLLDFDVLIDGEAPLGQEFHYFVYDKEKNCGETYIEIDTNDDETIESVTGKKIVLDIKEIYTLENVEDNLELLINKDVVAKGVWHFEWTLSGGDLKKEWTTSKEIGDTGMIMTYVRATPIGIYIKFKSELDSIDYNEDFYEKHYLYGISFLDGSCIYDALASGTFGWVFESDYDYYIDFELSKAINPEEIRSLLFIKKVPFNYDNPSEEDFYVIELNE